MHPLHKTLVRDPDVVSALVLGNLLEWNHRERLEVESVIFLFARARACLTTRLTATA